MFIGYSFSGEYQEYNELLRKFTLNNLLIRISEETAKIIKDPSGNHGYGTKSVEISLFNKQTGCREKQSVLVTGWNLIDLAYHAILSSNDYRGKEIDVDEELYLLVSATEAVRQKRESEFLDTIDDTLPDLFLYLWGFAGEQFKIQSLKKAFESATRELYILFEAAKKVDGLSDISGVVEEEIGVDWRMVIASLFLAWFGSTRGPFLSEIKKDIVWDHDFKEEDFDRVIDRYTATYLDIRTSVLGRQALYTRPFIRTQQRELISINAFLTLFLYEHSILWIVRDHYFKNGSQAFTSDFGRCFEAYFAELIEEYLTPENYSRISEESTRRADWCIEIAGYKFLIEQKSTVLGLMAKQQESNVEVIRTFVNRHILKAMRQLENTEREFDNGKYIKIILLYEDYLQTNVIHHIWGLDSCDVTNDDYYWLVTIEEMEMLLHLYWHNQDLFKTVIQEKITREVEKSTKGTSILQILDENGITSNEYLNKEKFSNYKRYARDTVRNHLRREP